MGNYVTIGFTGSNTFSPLKKSQILRILAGLLMRCPISSYITESHLTGYVWGTTIVASSFPTLAFGSLGMREWLKWVM